MQEVKNSLIRAELAKAGKSATWLAELMGITKQELSIALNTAEWSAIERRNAIQLIRENAGR